MTLTFLAVPIRSVLLYHTSAKFNFSLTVFLLHFITRKAILNRDYRIFRRALWTFRFILPFHLFEPELNCVLMQFRFCCVPFFILQIFFDCLLYKAFGSFLRWFCPLHATDLYGLLPSYLFQNAFYTFYKYLSVFRKPLFFGYQ